MWKYQETLERIFDAYKPADDLYAPQIRITDTSLCASQGPEYCEVTFVNGVFRIIRHVSDSRFSRTSEQEYQSEEEALLYWIGTFSYVLPKDSDTRRSVEDFEKYLSGISQSGVQNVRERKDDASETI